MTENVIEIRGEYHTREVLFNGKKLDPRRSQKVWNHSPDGFNWGYAGSGPSQLALAICLEFFDDNNKAAEVYQQFKNNVIAKLPQSDFNNIIDMAPFIKRGN